MAIMIHIKVYWAYITNNKGKKQYDVHGRSYRDVYEKFGHYCMCEEYLSENTWQI